MRRGLIEEDKSLDECLTENSLFQMPSSLRRWFTRILIFHELKDVAGLWMKQFNAMAEDYKRNNPNLRVVEQLVLIDIRNMLQSMGKDIRSFPLPQVDDAFNDAAIVPRELFEESSIEPNSEDVRLACMLKKEQKAAYDDIVSTFDTERGGLLFVDGPGGTGKTFFVQSTSRNHSQSRQDCCCYSYIWCRSIYNAWWENDTLTFQDPPYA
jgi:hypothetical protein